MSLINDALKRASQTTKDRPSQANLPAPMEPVREPVRPKSNFALVGILVAVVILVASGWFFLQWYHQRHARAAAPPVAASSTMTQKPVPIAAPKAQRPSPAPQQRPVATSPPGAIAVTQAAAPRSPAVVQPPPVRAPAVTPPPPTQPARVTAIPTAAVPAPSYASPPAGVQPAIPFPNLQVKGIFYNRKRPYALINGETVGEGERVLGVRVVQIQPDRVVLELNGRVKQLLLGE